MTGWRVEYEDGVPVRMSWNLASKREVRRCPRTWPHDPDGPWHTGEIVPAYSVTSFDCPGVPVEEAS